VRADDVDDVLAGNVNDIVEGHLEPDDRPVGLPHLPAHLDDVCGLDKTRAASSREE